MLSRVSLRINATAIHTARQPMQNAYRRAAYLTNGATLVDLRKPEAHTLKRYLTKDLRLQPYLPTMLCRFPRLFDTSPENAHQVVHDFLMTELGITSPRAIRRILVKCPWILKEDIDDRLVPHVTLLRHHAHFEDLSRAIIARPALLKRGAIAPLIALKRAKFSREQIGSLLMYLPLDLCKIHLKI